MGYDRSQVMSYRDGINWEREEVESGEGAVVMEEARWDT